MLAKRLLFAPCAGGSPAEKAIAEWHGMGRRCGHHRRLRQGMVHRGLKLLWTAPWSLVGLLIGSGTAQRRPHPAKGPDSGVLGGLPPDHPSRLSFLLRLAGGHLRPGRAGTQRPVPQCLPQASIGPRAAIRAVGAPVHTGIPDLFGRIMVLGQAALLRQPLRALGVPPIGMTMRSRTQLLRLCNTSWLLLGRPKSVNRRRSPLSTNLRSVPGERTYGSRPRATMPSTTRLTAMSIAACRIVSPLCRDRS